MFSSFSSLFLRRCRSCVIGVIDLVVVVMSVVVVAPVVVIIVTSTRFIVIAAVFVLLVVVHVVVMIERILFLVVQLVGNTVENFQFGYTTDDERVVLEPHRKHRRDTTANPCPTPPWAGKQKLLICLVVPGRTPSKSRTHMYILTENPDRDMGQINKICLLRSLLGGIGLSVRESRGISRGKQNYLLVPATKQEKSDRGGHAIEI